MSSFHPSPPSSVAGPASSIAASCSPSTVGPLPPAAPSSTSLPASTPVSAFSSAYRSVPSVSAPLSAPFSSPDPVSAPPRQVSAFPSASFSPIAAFYSFSTAASLSASSPVAPPAFSPLSAFPAPTSVSGSAPVSGSLLASSFVSASPPSAPAVAVPLSLAVLEEQVQKLKDQNGKSHMYQLFSSVKTQNTVHAPRDLYKMNQNKNGKDRVRRSNSLRHIVSSISRVFSRFLSVWFFLFVFLSLG